MFNTLASEYRARSMPGERRLFVFLGLLPENARVGAVCPSGFRVDRRSQRRFDKVYGFSSILESAK